MKKLSDFIEEFKGLSFIQIRRKNLEFGTIKEEADQALLALTRVCPHEQLFDKGRGLYCFACGKYIGIACEKNNRTVCEYDNKNHCVHCGKHKWSGTLSPSKTKKDSYKIKEKSEWDIRRRSY